MLLGKRLTAEQQIKTWTAPAGNTLLDKRDRALLAILLACGLRRHEAVILALDHLQQREEHWAIVDLGEPVQAVLSSARKAMIKSIGPRQGCSSFTAGSRP